MRQQVLSIQLLNEVNPVLLNENVLMIYTNKLCGVSKYYTSLVYFSQLI